MDALYQLTTKATQKKRAEDPEKGKANWGNYQCWWISFLEVARASGKLHDTFQPAGRLGAYYAQRNLAIPDQGVVPGGFLPTLPKCTNMIRAGTTQTADWTALKNHLVYGPEWQRMIMFYLLDPANRCDWKMPNDNINPSDRAAALNTLSGYLGIAGIEVQTGKSLDHQVESTVNGLENGQWLLVDKPNHAMAARFERIPPKAGQKSAVNRVLVYNQASGHEFACELTKVKDMIKLKSTTGKTVLNYYFIVKTNL